MFPMLFGLEMIVDMGKKGKMPPNTKKERSF